MKNAFHDSILNLIKEKSGESTKHTFLDSYLGNNHFRYSINMPSLRLIAKEWRQTNRRLTAQEFTKLLTSLIEAESST